MNPAEVIAREFCGHSRPRMGVADTGGWPCRGCRLRADTALQVLAGQGTLFGVASQPAALSDPTVNTDGKAARGGIDTSRAARLAVMPKTGSQRATILNLFKRGHYRPVSGTIDTMNEHVTAFTDEEVQALTGLGTNSVRPRRGELVEGGWLMDSGERRKTRGGNDAIVWMLTPQAAEAFVSEAEAKAEREMYGE